MSDDSSISSRQYGWRSDRRSHSPHTSQNEGGSQIAGASGHSMRLLHNFPQNRRPATWDKIDDPTVLLEKQFVRPPVGRILWTRTLEDILQDKLVDMSNVGNGSASIGKTNCSCLKMLTISRWWVAAEA